MSKTIIREGTFETNSSNTHGLIVCSESDWHRFKLGELLCNSNFDWMPTFLTKDEAIHFLKERHRYESEDDIDLHGYGIMTYDELDEYLENYDCDERDFNHVHIISYSGWD